MSEFVDKLDSIATNLWDRLPEFIVTLLVGLLAVEATIWVLDRVLRVVRISVGMKQVLYALARAFLWVVLVLVLLQSLGLDGVIFALAGSGVVVAIFLAPSVTPVVMDILSGLHLSSDNRFQPGVTVQAGEYKTTGVIERVGLRKTLIRTKDGKLHVIPNTMIDKHEWIVINENKPRPRRSTGRRK
jgi:small-conductance mechanosensitive channel